MVHSFGEDQYLTPFLISSQHIFSNLLIAVGIVGKDAKYILNR